MRYKSLDYREQTRLMPILPFQCSANTRGILLNKTEPAFAASPSGPYRLLYIQDVPSLSSSNLGQNASVSLTGVRRTKQTRLPQRAVQRHLKYSKGSRQDRQRCMALQGVDPNWLILSVAEAPHTGQAGRAGSSPSSLLSRGGAIPALRSCSRP